MISAYILSAIILFLFVYLWRSMRIDDSEHQTPNTEHQTPSRSFSIVIAIKNEALNIPNLCESLSKLIYDGEYEVIFVDDHSTDGSVEILKQYTAIYPHWRIIKQDSDKQGKTHALQTGINQSKHDYIALTDADCTIHANWLSEINSSLYTIHSSLIIGFSPEIYINSFQYFKQLVAAINYAASVYAGMPFSCSGRNLAFSKHAFIEVGGYDGLYAYGKGEDKLLLQKFYQKKMKVGYLPHPPILTQPVSKESALNQNLRRYSLLSITHWKWQLKLLFIGTLFVLLPVEFVLRWCNLHTYISLAVFLIAIEMYILAGCRLHRERFKPVYLLYTLIFPYYLAFQMITSPFRKWRWK